MSRNEAWLVAWEFEPGDFGGSEPGRLVAKVQHPRKPPSCERMRVLLEAIYPGLALHPPLERAPRICKIVVVYVSPEPDGRGRIGQGAMFNWAVGPPGVR